MDNKKEEFTKIYTDYINKIYRFVYLKVETQEIAEDITSKVFMKAWQAYNKKLTNIENINAFLYRIAQNSVIDHYRGKGRLQISSSHDTIQLSDDRTNIYEKTVLNDDIEKMKSAIKDLKKEYQDVIILHYLEDMSVAEVAGVLGKSETNVRVMIHRGINALRKKLIEEV